ncbi:MAG: Fe-S-containing protein, partial [Spirochaetaceae bacterium]|nr:Fe-S-containing protein [Spirochaetaceae bacterium]
MLRYFIQVVENLFTTAVLMALLWAAAYRGGPNWKKRFAWGCAAGTGGALVLAVLRRATALVNRSVVNGWTLSFALIAGIAYLALFWGFLKKRSPQTHETLSGSAGVLLGAALLFYALPDIFFYPTEFLLAGESPFSTAFLFKCAGYAGGILVTALTGIALFLLAGNTPVLPRGIILTAALGINMVNQSASIIQFLFARRIIPMIRGLFTFMMVAINHNVLFLYAVLGISFFLPLIVFAASLRLKPLYRNPAEHRKIRAGERRKRRRCVTVLAGYGVALVSLTALKAYSERPVVLSPAEPMTLAGTEILIPISQVEDGRLHRFEYTASDDTGVRFIVIKKNDAAYGVGLDACDICGATGYYERKDEVICRLCDVVMNISTIG